MKCSSILITIYIIEGFLFITNRDTPRERERERTITDPLWSECAEDDDDGEGALTRGRSSIDVVSSIFFAVPIKEENWWKHCVKRFFRAVAGIFVGGTEMLCPVVDLTIFSGWLLRLLVFGCTYTLELKSEWMKCSADEEACIVILAEHEHTHTNAHWNCITLWRFQRGKLHTAPVHRGDLQLASYQFLILFLTHPWKHLITRN